MNIKIKSCDEPVKKVKPVLRESLESGERGGEGTLDGVVREGFVEEVTVKMQRRSPGKAKNQSEHHK